MKKLSIYLFIITFLTTALAACSDSRIYKIGVSQCSQDDWRSKMNDEINREIMLHEDAEVEIRSADDSNPKQISDIRYFADNGFDIIIVSPNEAQALTPIIKEVYESGIPVIIFDRNIIGDSYTAHIGVDDKSIGREAAHYAFHILTEPPKVIEIYGLRGSTPAENRHNGFANELTAGGGKIIASEAGNWNKEEAIPIVDSLLKAHPEANLIYAHNDRMAIAAAEITRRHGRNDIKIIGIDAAPEIGIKAVADSIIDATFLYPTEGHRLIQTALAILKGEPYQREVEIPASSAVDLSNADILLLQNETLTEETRKMKLLKEKIDDYWAKHSSQTSLFYASIAIIVLLFGVFFLVLRSFWQHRRHQMALMERNRLLEEQRDMQKSLNEKLQEATQSKLMFFTNVSHDLRTPLTLISEPVSQLADAKNLTPQQHTLIKIADKNVKILRRLINQILDFRKYENGKLDLHLSEIDFGHAINEWMESFYAVARKRDIRLSLDTPAGAPVTGAFDAEKIERIFFNLISNAFKYTPDNGSIHVSYSVENERLTLKVADTGEGISERDLGNIFDRFYQADRIHPRGSGIGLSLVKAFVELHGGTISVKSALNEGSVFTVELPIRHISDTTVATEQNITPEDVATELSGIEADLTFDAAKPLLLIIDDNKDILRLVSELLNTSYNIITATNGRDGIRMATKYVPDLIICDVMMPVMDGMECCRRIKEEISTSHIPILMLTACSMDEQRIQGYDNGADGYLAKPFSGAVLASRCASLISNRKRIKEIWSGDTTPAAASATKCMSPDPQNPASKPTLPVSEIDNDFYRRFIEILKADMGNSDLNVDKIASKMGLERSQFYRKIKALTNYSPVELIRRIRLKHGHNLIVSTDKTISEIAYETGFSTPAYFTKCYRDAYGETPTEVRNRLGK